MKNFIKNTLAASALVLTAASCSDFGDVNINPESLNSGNVNYSMVFSNAQHQLLGSDWDGWRNQCIYAEQWMQHTASIGWWWSYNTGYAFSDGYSSAYWDGIYSGGRGAVRDVTTVLDLWKDDAEHVADYQLARITRVLVMSRLTDTYGDLPYFEAGRPTVSGYPKYDAQKDVYMDMLKELDEAHDALKGQTTAPMAKQDLYYGGDCAKWRSFASSLMLRLAMRLTNVDAATAQKYAAKAAANGDLILNYENNCKLNHEGGMTTNDSAEPVAKIYSHEDVSVGRLSRTLIGTLQNGGVADPRLGMIGSKFNPEDSYGSSIQSNAWVYGSSKAADQVGQPATFSWSRSSNWFGGKYYDEIAALTGDEKIIVDKDHPYDNLTDEQKKQWDYVDKGLYNTAFSFVGRYTYADPQAPTFILTAAQTNLALAEACLRGWVSGDAAAYYKAGIEQGVYQYQQFPQGAKVYGTALADCPLDAYTADKVAKFNAKDMEGKLSMIGTQYWIATFADSYETFANWRRTGYPELVSMYNPAYPEIETGEFSTEGCIPRRFTYNMGEESINGENYWEAVHKLEKTAKDCYPAGRKYGVHGNSWYTRVWWDCRPLKANEQKPTKEWGRTLPAAFNGFE